MLQQNSDHSVSVEARGDKMRHIIYLVALAGFLSGAHFSAASGGVTAPKYGPAVVPLSRDHAYVQAQDHPAPDFWALMPYYVPQQNDYSCAVASVAAVVNALTRAGHPLIASDRNATHDSLLATVKTARWKERMQKGGVDGTAGVTLEQLAEIVTEAFRQQGLSPVIDKVRVTTDDPATCALWRKTLVANERSADDLILIHFTQDTLTGAGGGPYPHISPVGAYDAGTGRVLVLDVDREWYEPYWVADTLVVRAMAATTPAFGSGGWLRISRKPR